MVEQIAEPAVDALSAGSTRDRAGSHAPMRIEIMTKLCADNSCPTVYRTSRDTLVIQGYAVDAEEAGVGVPPNERLVEVPVELLRAAALDLG